MIDSNSYIFDIFVTYPGVASGLRMRAALRCMMSLRLVGRSLARIEGVLRFGPELRMGTGLKCSNLFPLFLDKNNR